jgi:hypothetical protein
MFDQHITIRRLDGQSDGVLSLLRFILRFLYLFLICCPYKATIDADYRRKCGIKFTKSFRIKGGT